MHVLCLIDSLSPAGAERSLATLVHAFTQRSVLVDVAYLNDGPGLQVEVEAAGGNLYCLDGTGGRVGWILRARQLIAERMPDLVHTTLFEADVAGRVAARSTGVPVVSSLVGLSYGWEQRSDPSLTPWKLRGAQVVDAVTAQLVVRFHAVAAHVAHLMSQRLAIPRDRIDVIPRGRDPEGLGRRESHRSAQVRSALDLDSSDRAVLAVARHERKKGLDTLLLAFPLVQARVPQAQLIVAGLEGSQTPLLRTTLARLGLERQVRFLGPRGDVPDLLCGVDAFVLPSWSEGFPGALLEAMALEAPIVASDIPAVREAVGNDGLALLVPPRRPEELAAAIIETLGERDAAAERARRARARFLTHYAVDRVAELMLAFYERALNQARGGWMRAATRGSGR